MFVTTDVKDDVAIVKMDDGKANAVGHDLLESLELCLDDAAQSAKAVVLAGRDGKFCAGYDLKTLQSGNTDAISKLVDRGGRMVKTLYGYPKPLVAAATGHAVALGAFWLLACDTRVGARGSFKYGLNETAIGMPIPQFGLAIAAARLNPSSMTPSVLQSRIYDADSAVSAGFLDVAVEENQVIAASIDIAKQLATLPAAAYADNKRALRRSTLEAMGV